jgi:hypothetical protein
MSANSIEGSVSRQSSTPMPNTQVALTPAPPSPTKSASLTETDASTATGTVTATDAPFSTQETRLIRQCLEVDSALPSDAISRDIVVMDNNSLLNMTTGQITQITGKQKHLDRVAISLDMKLMAFDNILLNKEGHISGYELNIATADGEQQKVIPFEDKWMDIIDWTNDQRLLLSYDESITSSDGHQISISYLVMDPFTGEQQILRPDFPNYFNITIPWYRRGVIYDPALTRAIYARFIDENEEMYTLGLWDVDNQLLVTSLENVFLNSVYFSKQTPLPRWSPDGSQFVVVGVVLAYEELVTFEIYRVSRDGQVEQLTQLSPTARIYPTSLSWSPNGHYIAMFLDDWYGIDNPRVALLDMETLEITDYCIPVRGVVPPPLWSPDGTQFLVVDRYEDDHQYVILVDIVQGFAAIITEDMEPVGWMVSPQE